MQDGVDAVALPGLLLHQRAAAGNQMAQLAGCVVGHPDLGNEVRGQELRQNLGVHLVGLDLGARDGPRAQGIGDNHATGVLAQQVGHRPGVDRGLEHMMRPIQRLDSITARGSMATIL